MVFLGLSLINNNTFASAKALFDKSILLRFVFTSIKSMQKNNIFASLLYILTMKLFYDCKAKRLVNILWISSEHSFFKFRLCKRCSDMDLCNKCRWMANFFNCVHIPDKRCSGRMIKIRFQLRNWIPTEQRGEERTNFIAGNTCPGREYFERTIWGYVLLVKTRYRGSRTKRSITEIQ